MIIGISCIYKKFDTKLVKLGFISSFTYILEIFIE